MYYCVLGRSEINFKFSQGLIAQVYLPACVCMYVAKNMLLLVNIKTSMYVCLHGCIGVYRACNCSLLSDYSTTTSSSNNQQPQHLFR